MSKKTTNLLGIVVAIIAGTYFNIMLCSTCTNETDRIATIETTKVIGDNKELTEEKQQSNEPNSK